MSGYLPQGSAGAAAGAVGAKLGGDLRAMALAHRECDPRAAMSRGKIRATATLLILVNLALGGLLLTTGVAATDSQLPGRIMMAAVGLFWTITALLLARGWSLRPSKRRLVSTTTVNGRPATVIRMSRHRMLETLWVSGGIVVLCIAGSILSVASDMAELLFFTGLLVLILLPVALDMILALSRPVGITLTPDGIDVRSWYSRAAVPWSEVWWVRLAIDTHGTRLRITTRNRRPEGTAKRLFSFWPGQERSTLDELIIDVDAIEPHGRPLEALLTEIAGPVVPIPGQRRRDDITSRMGTPWAEQALQPRQPDERPDGIIFH